MTREIKFRIWDCHTKEMAGPKGMSFTCDNGRIDHFWNRVSDYEQRGNATRPLDQERYKVMQFTGLKDKNGKDVYEGDLLGSVCLNTSITDCEIIFKGGCFSVRQLGGEGWIDFAASYCERYEVIGNIYENPELLKPTANDSKSDAAVGGD